MTQSKNSKTKTSQFKNYIQDNMCCVWYPREARGHLIRSLVQIGWDAKQKELDQNIKKVEEHLSSLPKGRRNFLMLDWIDFSGDAIEDILTKSLEGTDKIVFANHYHHYDRHRRFIDLFQIKKHICITISEGASKALNARRETLFKEPAPFVTQLETAHNKMFPEYLSLKYPEANILEIKYEDLNDTEQCTKQLTRINDAFSMNLPINRYEKILELYYT